MNSIIKKGFHPFSWFLALFGWTFSARYRSDDNPKYWRWGFYRIGFDQYERAVTGNGKQRLISITSETYWFSPPTRKLHLSWEIHENQHALKVVISIPFVCLHFLKFTWFKKVWFSKYTYDKYGNAAEYGLRIDKDALVWNWRQDTMTWAADGSTGFHYYFSWDKFRDMPKRKVITFLTVNQAFTMPASRTRAESQHEMTIALQDIWWCYRRPWNKDRLESYADISFASTKEGGQRPPLFGGKGENSWDCGDDGIFGCSVRMPGTGSINDIIQAGGTEMVLKNVVEQYIQMVNKERQQRD